MSPDGQPQSAVVGVAFTDRGEAVFDTIGSSRKARNLRRDPRASLVIWEGERTVQMEGRIDEPTGAEREAIVKVYLATSPTVPSACAGRASPTFASGRAGCGIPTSAPVPSRGSPSWAPHSTNPDIRRSRPVEDGPTRLAVPPAIA